MKFGLPIAIATVLIGVVIFIFISAPDEMSRVERETLVEKYLQENISTLSPELEVLGGTFYVTRIVFIGENTGEVFYEDGHIALVADFTYDVASNGTAEVTLLNVRDAGDKL